MEESTKQNKLKCGTRHRQEQSARSLSGSSSSMARGRSEVCDGNHNHKPADNLSAYAAARTLDKDRRQEIQQQVSSGIAPRPILCKVREMYPNCRSTHRDVYNVKFAMKVDMLARRSPLEALLDSLVDRQIMHYLRLDERGALTHRLRNCKKTFRKWSLST